MTISFDDVEVEYHAVGRREFLKHGDDLLVGYTGYDVFGFRLLVSLVHLFGLYHALFLAVVVDGGIDHDRPEPGFERLSEIELADVVEELHKTIV